MKTPEDPEAVIDRFLRTQDVPESPGFRARTLERLQQENYTEEETSRKVIPWPWLSGVALAATIAVVAGLAVLSPSGAGEPALTGTEPWADALTTEMFILADNLEGIGPEVIGSDVTDGYQWARQL